MLGHRRGLDGLQLVGGGPRHVDAGGVGVARAQLADRLPLARRDARLDPAALVLDVDRRAGADDVGPAHALHRDLDPVLPALLAGPVGRQVERRVVAGLVVAPGRPAAAVELVERAHLPVGGPLRLHAHDLGAGAAPVHRPVVAVAPVEADGVLGPEALGERLVVEPRLAAVGGGGQRQRAREREPDQRGDAEPGPQRQPLEPQEADRQHGQRRAEQQRPRPAHRDHGRGGQHEQRGQRQERVAARAVRARPQREQTREHHQRGAEQLQHQRRPRVGALVGEPDRAQRLRPADQPGAELVEPPRPQQPEVEARREVGGEQAGQRRRDHRVRARALGKPLAGDHGAGREHREQDPQQRPSTAAGRRPSAATARRPGRRAPRSRRAAPPTPAAARPVRAPAARARTRWRRRRSPPAFSQGG